MRSGRPNSKPHSASGLSQPGGAASLPSPTLSQQTRWWPPSDYQQRAAQQILCRSFAVLPW